MTRSCLSGGQVNKLIFLKKRTKNYNRHAYTVLKLCSVILIHYTCVNWSKLNYVLFSQYLRYLYAKVNYVHCFYTFLIHIEVLFLSLRQHQFENLVAGRARTLLTDFQKIILKIKCRIRKKSFRFPLQFLILLLFSFIRSHACALNNGF